MAKEPNFAAITPAQEADLLYHAIGGAISQWAFVEQGLVGLFARLISPVSNVSVQRTDGYISPAGSIYQDMITAEVILSAVENFRSKLAVVDAVMTSNVKDYPMLLACWAKIYIRVRKASGHRNKLAHWAVQVRAKERPGHRARLMPPRMASLHLDPNAPRYTYRDVVRFVEVFRKLHEQLNNFGIAISSTPALHDRFARLTGGQIQTYDLHNPSVAKRLRQHLQALDQGQPV